MTIFLILDLWSRQKILWEVFTITEILTPESWVNYKLAKQSIFLDYHVGFTFHMVTICRCKGPPTEWPMLVRACADSSICFGLNFRMACMTHLSLVLQKWQLFTFDSSSLVS